MKRTVIIGVLLLAVFQCWAQNIAIYNPMRDALKAGDAKELVKYFNSSIDLTLEGDVSTFSKTQAEFVLRDFFKKHPPADFNIAHTGASKAGLQFAIGNYQSGSDHYTVLLRVREVEKKYLIHEMSFTKE